MRQMFSNIPPSVKHVIKILITAGLFYGSTQLRFVLNFIPLYNYDYSPFWPAGGIVFALMVYWGYSIWPGIAIGSLLVSTGMQWWTNDSYSLTQIATTALIFAVGRSLEPLVGVYLLQKFKVKDNPFQCPGNSLKFIFIVFVAAWISTLFGSTGFELLEPGDVDNFRARTLSWYLDHISGMLIMTPLVISVFKLRNTQANLFADVVFPALMVLVFTILVVLLSPQIESLQMLIFNSIPFLIIPIIILLAFNFDLFVSSLLVLMVSVLIIFFTINGLGVFVVDGNWQGSIWLIQSYLIVGALTNIILFSAASERRHNEALLAIHSNELQQANEKLNATLANLKQAMTKAESSEKLKSSFLANISHEIRTPMNAVLGLTELLERPDLAENKKQEFARLLKQRSEDLLRIMDEIMLVSQIEANYDISQKEAVNIQELFTSLHREFAEKVKLQHGSEVTITYNLNAADIKKKISLDKEYLTMVLTRLLDNANKFTSKGSISFDCRYIEPNVLQFSVSDTGIGIARNSVEFIFEPFRHADEQIHLTYGGVGAGLAICKSIVMHWGGKIWVESEPGKGSTFFFTLPLNANSSVSENKLVSL